MIPSSYPTKDEIARLAAGMLLEIGAITFNAETPFAHASGKQAPTYVDCRKLISFPRIRSTLMDFLTVTIMREAGFEAFDNIAGGETADVPLTAPNVGLAVVAIRATRVRSSCCVLPSKCEPQPVILEEQSVDVVDADFDIEGSSLARAPHHWRHSIHTSCSTAIVAVVAHNLADWEEHFFRANIVPLSIATSPRPQVHLDHILRAR